MLVYEFVLSYYIYILHSEILILLVAKFIKKIYYVNV